MNLSRDFTRYTRFRRPLNMEERFLVCRVSVSLFVYVYMYRWMNLHLASSWTVRRILFIFCIQEFYHARFEPNEYYDVHAVVLFRGSKERYLVAARPLNNIKAAFSTGSGPRLYISDNAAEGQQQIYWIVLKQFRWPRQTNPSSYPRGGPLPNCVGVKYENKDMVTGPDGALHQE
jgi:hypothetical protein